MRKLRARLASISADSLAAEPCAITARCDCGTNAVRDEGTLGIRVGEGEALERKPVSAEGGPLLVLFVV